MVELHRLGEVSLAPSGGRLTGWSGLHRLSTLPWPSTPRVDTCTGSRELIRHKTWPASRPMGPFDLRFDPLGTFRHLVNFTLSSIEML
jgi:hypothetical protein